jgi:hypothetical protein
MDRGAKSKPSHRRTGLSAALLAAGWLAVEGAAALVGVSAVTVPAQAQFFDFFARPPGSIPGGGYQQRQRQQQQQQRGFGFGFFGGDNWNYRQHDPWAPPPPRRVERPQVERPQPQGDFSKAPPPARKEAEAPINVLVLGDSMADWLAYGLEDAFSDTPELGVTRRHRTGSGLLRSEGRDAYDWVQGAKDSVARDKADFVVMMIGLGDRHPIRERQPARANQPAGQKPGEPAKPAEAPKAADPAKPAEAAKPAEVAKPAETAKAGDSQEAEVPAPEQPAPAGPETGRPGAVVSYEFRSDKWSEIYGRRIDETIAALKTKRVPVIWVGLPPIRGTRSRAEVSFLNEMYKARAEKAGSVYVDVWDGFMDESGEFSNFGPDIIGQNRRLRAGDGVHFTKAGARKLAHYVEREIRRLLNQATPVALPIPDEPQKPLAVPQPSGPAPRPVAGPVVPLTGHTPAAEALLGSAGQGNVTADSVAVRVLVKGEPVEAPSGRADHFSWPRTDGAVADQIEPADPIASAQPRPAAPAAAARAALPRAGQRPPPQSDAKPARAVR